MKRRNVLMWTAPVVTAIMLPLMALSGCATTQGDISRANAYCAENGGVTQISPKYNGTVRVTCGNTAAFKFTSNGATQ